MRRLPAVSQVGEGASVALSRAATPTNRTAKRVGRGRNRVDCGSDNPRRLAHTIDLSGCQSQMGRQHSSKCSNQTNLVLTFLAQISPLTRPMIFIDLHATSYGSEG